VALELALAMVLALVLAMVTAMALALALPVVGINKLHFLGLNHGFFRRRI